MIFFDNNNILFFQLKIFLIKEDDRDKKLLLNFPLRYMPKRAPSGFMGMRGKRLFDDDIEQLNKRAPSGFLGKHFP